ncbi:MAG: hypothetical protein Q4F28_08620 [Eubacteriales bacterium]|nr:hypothetical protein [Eubacteriales bacterium]
MDTCFASLTGNNYFPDPNDDIMDSLFKQYEHVIVESLISSFGLDFLIKDQHGGDVDTIHNVRVMDSKRKDFDSEMSYKSTANQQAYENRGTYDNYSYHGGSVAYRETTHNARKDFNEKGQWITDAYTNDKIGINKALPNEKRAQLDHVISAKNIHDDRGRVLAGVNGVDLANSPDNLRFTNMHLNNNMKDKNIPDYIKWCEENPEKVNWNGQKGSPLPADVKEKMMSEYSRAQKAADAKINQAYYTSKAFRTDTAKAAGTVGIQMGIRQAVGLIFTEVWFAVQDEFDHVQHPFDLSDFLVSIGNGIKKGFANAKSKYREILNKFKDGAIAGILSSLTTTICNIFFTTAKNVVKLIRQSYASLVEAAKILFINPENFPYGERMRATAKILASGASVVVGTIVSDAIGKTGINTIPILNEIVPTFCGTLVTGILTCTLLYYLDRSESMNKLVSVLNTLPTLSTEVDYYKKQAVYFEHYAAELMQIDLEKFKEETTMYTELADSISTAKDQNELNKLLKNAVKTIGIEIPWGDDFNAFMNDKSKVLRFE